MVLSLLVFLYEKYPRFPKWLFVLVLVGISIYIYSKYFMQVAYAMDPNPIIMQGKLGGVYKMAFEMFKEQFIEAMNACTEEIDHGSVTFQEIMAKQSFFTQSMNHKILKVALECKCNQPVLGWGSTALTKAVDGQITHSAILTQLLN